MISVVFTCKGRPSLTELCLRRFKELMTEEHELMIAYDGYNEKYMDVLRGIVGKKTRIFHTGGDASRFALINRALDECSGKYFMHLENDFYWDNPFCLDYALEAFEQHPDVDYVRLEWLPFTDSQFKEYRNLRVAKIGIMKDNAPYRFTFNPHLRREKFPCGRFLESGFTKQPEQHHNDSYVGTSACLSGKNFRHLGIYDERGHYKPWYAERFTLRRGERTIGDPLEEFTKFCRNPEYYNLFWRYMRDHGYKHD